jgi:hypothetical protein
MVKSIVNQIRLISQEVDKGFGSIIMVNIIY